MLYKDKTIYELDTYYISQIEYKDDCRKIQQAFNNHAIQLTLLECQEIYSNYSDRYCAGWECGVGDYTLNNIFFLLLPHLKEMLLDKADRTIVLHNTLEANGYYSRED